MTENVHKTMICLPKEKELTQHSFSDFAYTLWVIHNTTSIDWKVESNVCTPFDILPIEIREC